MAIVELHCFKEFNTTASGAALTKMFDEQANVPLVLRTTEFDHIPSVKKMLLGATLSCRFNRLMILMTSLLRCEVPNLNTREVDI